jgi:RNA polymerase sigma factor (sigma-70 family)
MPPSDGDSGIPPSKIGAGGDSGKRFLPECGGRAVLDSMTDRSQEPTVPAPHDSPQNQTSLYEAYLDQVRDFFATVERDPQAAEDLMQELHVRVLRFPQDQTLQDPLAYLFRMAWNVFNDAIERARLRREHTVICDPNKLERFVREQGYGANLWMRDLSGTIDTGDEIARVLRRLKPRERNAVILHFRDGLTYKEIAKQLGVTEHAVKKYICKALKLFREHFGIRIPAKSPGLPKL